MLKARRSGKALVGVSLLILVGAAVVSGCETRVIRSEGIGASTTHPTTEEPAGSDPVSRKLFGDPKR